MDLQSGEVIGSVLGTSTNVKRILVLVVSSALRSREREKPRDGNAQRRPAHGDTVRTGTLQPPDYPLLSIYNISININKVDKAIADLELRD